MESRALPVTAFRAGEGFLPQKQRLIRDVAIPYQYAILNDRVEGAEKSHAIENLRLAGKKLHGEAVDGEFYGMVFQDSDPAKWLEAASYALAQGPDPKLKSQVDELISLLAKAQWPDGYLNSYFTLKNPERRWTNLYQAHELYCAGHLMEAACAHYEATGETTLLSILERYADHIYHHFMKECPDGYSGHPEIELALMRLYQATGKEKYKDLACHFLDVRGQAPNYFAREQAQRGWDLWGGEPLDSPEKTDYNQSTLPVREQQDAVGHAVRAVYLYAAMAACARETGDASLRDACLRLWDSITRRRMYVTGAIGSTEIGEAFTVDYDLPNDTAYAETCASVGLVFFARRMLELEVRGEYADVMERALYNTVLAGMQLDGKRFFYVNPLEVVPGISGVTAAHRHVLPQRPPWYACACCPPNVARLLASLGSYAYGVGHNTLFIHLYLGGTVDTGLGYSLSCETEYPHTGTVTFHFLDPAHTSLAIRVPGWSRTTSLTVNGEEVDLSPILRDGYAFLTRSFARGDEVVLTLDMTPRKVYASPKVPADTGKAAVQRGPLVYCAEGVDNGGDVLSLSLDREGVPQDGTYDPDLLGGVIPVTVPGWRTADPECLYTDTPPERARTEITLIPYYAWGNRGAQQMRVWLPEQ